MLAPCGFGDVAELAGLFNQAGFSSVEVRTVTLKRQPTGAAEAIGGNLAALPVADKIQAMDAVARTEMIEDIAATLADHVTNGELTAPSSANIAVAIA